jgi:hypothetical protein
VDTPGFAITLDHPPKERNEPRGGHGHSSHARLSGRHDESAKVPPMFAAAFVSRHTSLRRLLDPLWTSPGSQEVERLGDAFWFTAGASMPERSRWRIHR